MTAITTLRNEIVKHPADSDVARLLAWAELTMGDLHDRIFELEEEVRLLEADRLRRVTALNEVRYRLGAMSDYILRENFDMPADTFARDPAPFKNVIAQGHAVAHHGAPPHAKRGKRFSTTPTKGEKQ